MRTLITVAFTFFFFSLGAQPNVSKPITANKTKQFRSQGEQEDYWAKLFFKKNYVKGNFPRYEGTVSVNGDSFLFSDQTLVVTNTSEEFKKIIEKGIFYPSVITGQVKTKTKSKEELDSLSEEEKLFYNLSRTDSFTISDLEELKFLNKPTRKRFRFLLYRKSMLNPTVCFFELTNKGATGKTDTETFINGAVLTFFKAGWISI
jgi:hypothetical protein